MNEKIKTIAEFDGWEIDGSLAYRGMGAVPTHSLNYLTDLNALHLVALDVMDRLDSVVMRHDIMSAFRCRPVNGQYTDLVDAVYDAIVYLKKHDQCQPK